MRTVAVVLAGGTGQRFGGGLPKQLQLLAGKPLVEHSIAAFEAAPGVDSILLVMAAGFADQAGSSWVAASTASSPGSSRAAPLGRTRPAARSRRSAASECNVLLHDAARPLVDQRIIADCVTALGSVPGGGGGRPLARHDRGGQRRRDDADAKPGEPAALPDPAGIPALGAQAGPRARPGRLPPSAPRRPPTTAASCCATCPRWPSRWCRAASATSRSPTRRTWTWLRRCSAASAPGDAPIAGPAAARPAAGQASGGQASGGRASGSRASGSRDTRVVRR